MTYTPNHWKPDAIFRCGLSGRRVISLPSSASRPSDPGVTVCWYPSGPVSEYPNPVLCTDCSGGCEVCGQ